MIPEIGHFALILALLLSIAQSVFGLGGAARRNDAWLAAAGSAVVGQFVFVAVAFGAWLWGAAGALMATPALIVLRAFALRMIRLRRLRRPQPR